jgi:hypothetical protein
LATRIIPRGQRSGGGAGGGDEDACPCAELAAGEGAVGAEDDADAAASAGVSRARSVQPVESAITVASAPLQEPICGCDVKAPSW